MTQVQELCARAKDVAPLIAAVPGDVKDHALDEMASALIGAREALMEANQTDLADAEAGGTEGPLIDRLRLTTGRVESMAHGLRAVREQTDPVGERVRGWKRPNGLVVEEVRVPLGVVAVIYEARPNVTADVAGLCLKSGNACVLRGSAIARNSNAAIVGVLSDAADRCGIPSDAIQLVTATDRRSAIELMQAKGFVDLLVPRGGQTLIRTVEDSATVPYIIDGAGVCHVYVDRSAEPRMATAIVINAKTQRPSVCNAAETLLVHSDFAKEWLPGVLDELREAGVEIRGDAYVRELWPGAVEASSEDWGSEYLDLILAVRVVGSVDDAIDHIDKWGTSNAEAIVTDDVATARHFAERVDSGSVFVNASTRFSDGGEFGFGSEIGISTQKLHVRGPMGLRALTTSKYVVWGNGQVRS